jgi:hypothetical protein
LFTEGRERVFGAPTSIQTTVKSPYTENYNKYRTGQAELNSTTCRDAKGEILATVQSSSAARISRQSVVIKHGKYYVESNSLREPVNVVIVMKAMSMYETYSQ